MTTRAEHVQWCKQRALEYLPGDPRQALGSMLSDMRKHDETIGVITDMGPIVIFEMMNPTPESARRFIEGFAE